MGETDKAKLYHRKSTIQTIQSIFSRVSITNSRLFIGSDNSDQNSYKLPGWIGDHLMRLERHKKGLQYYDESLRDNSEDASLLCKRATANAKLFKFKTGLTDVERALEIDPRNMDAVARRARFMLLSGEFEKSLLLSKEYLKIRKQPPCFALMVLDAKNTINNCVGLDGGYPLRDHYEIIRELAWMKNMSMQKGRPKRKKYRKREYNPSTHIISTVRPAKTLNSCTYSYVEDKESVPCVHSKVSMEIPTRPRKKASVYSDEMKKARMSVESICSLIGQPFQSFDYGLSMDPEHPYAMPKLRNYPFHPLQKRTTNIENYMASVYIGSMLHEKNFLTALPNRAGCMGKNLEANDLIVDYSKEGVTILDKTQDILRTRTPFYYIKFQEYFRESEKHIIDELIALDLKRDNVIKKLNNFFTEIAKYVKKLDLYHMIKTAERMYKYCKETYKTILPKRDYVLSRLYKLVGEGFMLSHRFIPGMDSRQMLLRVHLALGLPLAKSDSLESIVRRFKGKCQNWSELIKMYEQRVRACKHSDELIWLYHELARFNIELKNYSIARNYALNCIHEARKCEDFKWAFNAYMLKAKVFVMQKNKNDAKRQLKFALNTARNLNNEDLEVFVQECLEVVNDWKFQSEEMEQIFIQREQRILQIISTYDQKREAAGLFDNILSKPMQRRFRIIPGFVQNDEENDSKRNTKLMNTCKKVSEDDFPISTTSYRLRYFL